MTERFEETLKEHMEAVAAHKARVAFLCPFHFTPAVKLSPLDLLAVLSSVDTPPRLVMHPHSQPFSVGLLSMTDKGWLWVGQTLEEKDAIGEWLLENVKAGDWMVLPGYFKENPNVEEAGHATQL